MLLPGIALVLDRPGKGDTEHEHEREGQYETHHENARRRALGSLLRSTCAN